jgi:uncharacterized protein YqjF (DUF2071 family)
VLLSLRVRDLLLASWDADREQIARTLPPGVRPLAVDGRHLVSIAALRYAGGRLGALPVPPFSQLNVRTCVEHDGEPAVLFLLARVSAPGMLGALFGAPYRLARLRFARGSAEAPGLGVRLAYEPRGATEPTPLTEHLLGLFEAAGLRAFRIRRGPAVWQQADLVAPPHADPLLALGFDVSAPPSLLYAERTEFEAEVPPRRVG